MLPLSRVLELISVVPELLTVSAPVMFKAEVELVC